MLFPRSHDLVQFFFILLAACIACRGIGVLLLPPIYQLARTQNFWLHYEGQFLLALAATLVVFQRWMIEKTLWVSQEIHRIASVLVMVWFIGIDAMMHVFNIPHIEGWWLPMVGGSAALSFVSGRLRRFRQRHRLR